MKLRWWKCRKSGWHKTGLVKVSRSKVKAWSELDDPWPVTTVAITTVANFTETPSSTTWMNYRDGIDETRKRVVTHKICDGQIRGDQSKTNEVCLKLFIPKYLFSQLTHTFSSVLLIPTPTVPLTSRLGELRNNRKPSIRVDWYSRNIQKSACGARSNFSSHQGPNSRTTLSWTTRYKRGKKLKVGQIDLDMTHSILNKAKRLTKLKVNTNGKYQKNVTSADRTQSSHVPKTQVIHWEIKCSTWM